MRFHESYVISHDSDAFLSKELSIARYLFDSNCKLPVIGRVLGLLFLISSVDLHDVRITSVFNK